jgi:hypothetical protein
LLRQMAQTPEAVAPIHFTATISTESGSARGRDILLIDRVPLGRHALAYAVRYRMSVTTEGDARSSASGQPSSKITLDDRAYRKFADDAGSPVYKIGSVQTSSAEIGPRRRVGPSKHSPFERGGSCADWPAHRRCARSLRCRRVEAGVAAPERGDGWWGTRSFPFARALLQLLTRSGMHRATIGGTQPGGTLRHPPLPSTPQDQGQTTLATSIMTLPSVTTRQKRGPKMKAPVQRGSSQMPGSLAAGRIGNRPAAATYVAGMPRPKPLRLRSEL